MSTLAVFLVLAGASAWAASQLHKNSVGPKQLKKNAVTTAKIKNGAVTGSKIRLSSLGTVPSATHAATAGDATTLQGNGPAAFVSGNGEVLSARRDLQIGDEVELLALPGIGTLTATCQTGTTKPLTSFYVNNRSGGPVDQTLEYGEGIDATTVPDGGEVSDGHEGIVAIRMKVATRSTPATIATLDLNAAAEPPVPCSAFVQVVLSRG
ncbi:MAG TPA: hypothetical protein VH476_02835 [Solirubrobacterales bacterium]|jgi:hypothetical protein